MSQVTEASYSTQFDKTQYQLLTLLTFNQVKSTKVNHTIFLQVFNYASKAQGPLGTLTAMSIQYT